MLITYNINNNINMVSESDNTFSLPILQPIIPRINKFTTESVEQFNSEITKIHTTNQDIIPIVCDSFGGQVYSLLAMIDIVQSSPLPVATIIEGKAMSCGAILASCGDKGKRYMAPNATIMIHDVSSFEVGKAAEIKSGAKETERLNKIVYEILDKNCNQPKGFFYKKVRELDRADWFIGAKEAKKLKLIDVIGIPKFQINISVTTELKV